MQAARIFTRKKLSFVGWLADHWRGFSLKQIRLAVGSRESIRSRSCRRCRCCCCFCCYTQQSAGIAAKSLRSCRRQQIMVFIFQIIRPICSAHKKVACFVIIGIHNPAGRESTSMNGLAVAANTTLMASARELGYFYLKVSLSKAQKTRRRVFCAANCTSLNTLIIMLSDDDFRAAEQNMIGFGLCSALWLPMRAKRLAARRIGAARCCCMLPARQRVAIA